METKLLPFFEMSPTVNVKMKTQIKEITPKWAAQILETRNPRNRRISDKVVAKYANDMCNGDWSLTHQGIAFDENGDLLDGQHRLAAIVKANKAIPMLVSTGIPLIARNNGHDTSVFGLIDGVRPRTPATMLDLLQHKNAKAVSSIARSMVSLCSADGSPVISASGIRQIVLATKGSIDRVASLSTGSRIINLRTSALAVIAFYHTVRPEEAEAFLIETQTVTGKSGSPSRALARWAGRNKATGGSAAINLIYVTASALFHHHKGNSVEKLFGGEDALRWVVSVNPSLKKSVISLVGK